MSENTIALIAIATTTVASVILQVMARWDAVKVARKVDEVRSTAARTAVLAEKTGANTVSKLNDLNVKTDHVIELTNSTLSAAKEALRVSRERVAALEKAVGIEPGSPLPDSEDR